MGNTCCPPKNSEGEQPVGRKPQKAFNASMPIVGHQFEGKLFGIAIIVKTGNLSEEGADAIVIGTDNFVKNRSNSFLAAVDADKLNKEVAAKRGNSDEPLQNGQVIVTGPATLKNVEHVIHIAIPVWRGGMHKELVHLQTGFVNALNEATSHNLKRIIFTDPASSLFGIPKQHTAKTLIDAIKQYGESCESLNKVQSIVFVHRETETVRIFEDFLKQEMGIVQDRAQSAYSDHLQGSLISDLEFNDVKVISENQFNINEKVLSDDLSTQQDQSHP